MAEAMMAPAIGGKERNPVKAPKKKMKLARPVTLNRFAVHEIPLANWNDEDGIRPPFGATQMLENMDLPSLINIYISIGKFNFVR